MISLLTNIEKEKIKTLMTKCFDRKLQTNAKKGEVEMKNKVLATVLCLIVVLSLAMAGCAPQPVATTGTPANDAANDAATEPASTEAVTEVPAGIDPTAALAELEGQVFSTGPGGETP